MVLPTFDDALHSIGLGATGGTLYGFMIQPGSYRKAVQERDTRRISIGPNRWVQDYKVSQWAQEDFSGGAYQERWNDEAMFMRSVGFIPALDKKALRTTPSLRHCKSTDVTPLTVNFTNYTGINPYIAYCYAWNKLFILGNDDKVYVFNSPATVVGGTSYDGDVDVYSKDVARSTTNATSIAANTVNSTIIVGYDDGRVNEYTYAATTSVTLTLWRIFTYETTSHSGIPTGYKYVSRITVYGDYVLVAMKNRVLYYSASDMTTSGSVTHSATPAWTLLGAASGEYVRAFAQQGSLMVILSGAWDDTFLDSTNLADGILPWIEVPYMFKGMAMAAYAGRLYVGGHLYNTDSSAGSAALFEISGGTFREIRTFYGMDSQFGAEGEINGIESLTVHEGMLYFCNDVNKCLEAYDFITDSLYSCYSVDDVNDGGTPKFVQSAGSTIYVWCSGTGADGGLLYAPKENFHNVDNQLVTSEFFVEPALLKTWGEVVVHTRYGGCDLEASLDGGVTWTGVARTAEVITGYYYESTFELSALAASKGLVLKIIIEADDDFEVASVETGIYLYYWRELVAFSVSFVLEPAKLHLWNVAVAAVENPELLDFTRDDLSDPELVIDSLWDWYSAGQLLDFLDRDGVQHLAVITQLQEVEPHMRGAVGTDLPQREAFMTMTLAEMAT